MSSRPDHYDAIVIGVGGMGSASVYHLAERGLDVLGIERFDIPHRNGSSHGSTRIFRLVQHERPEYVPLAQRARELWRDLEDATGTTLLYTTGSINAGPPESDTPTNAIRVCESFDLPYEDLTGREVNDRHPGYSLPPDHRAVYQPDGGFLACEECIVAHTDAALAKGATIRAREQVTAWDPHRDGVRVSTTKGTYDADALVIAAGAWTAKLVAHLEQVAVPERRIMAWLQPHEPAHFSPDTFPVFMVDVAEGHYYGFPMYNIPGFKFGRSPDLAEVVDPDQMDQEPTVQEEAVHRQFAERYFPRGAGPTTKLQSCMITRTPEQHFILDHHPEYPQVTVAAGFSGNGYKFCSVVGEIMADLATTGDTEHNIDMCAFPAT